MLRRNTNKALIVCLVWNLTKLIGLHKRVSSKNWLTDSNLLKNKN